MKKFISIFLAVLLLGSCLVIPVFGEEANTIDWPDGYVISGYQDMQSNKTYRIGSGVTVSTASGTTIYVPENTTIKVEKGGTFILKSQVIALAGSQILVDGTIQNSSNIILNDGASANVLVHFPKLVDQGLVYTTKNETTGENETHPRLAVYYCTTPDLNTTILDSIVFNQEKLTLAYTIEEDDKKEVLSDELFYIPWEHEIETYVPINQYLFIYAHIIEPDEDDEGIVKPEIGSNQRDCKYDDGEMDVFINDSGIGYRAGIHYAKITGTGNISYGAWTKDSDFYETYKVVLPSGNGYTVVSADGLTADDSPIYMKYNDSFTFKVDIDEDYDKSTYFVYIYNGYGWLNVNTEGRIAAEPDSYGWYHIDHVKGDCTIQVLGVVENKTVDMIGSILEAVRNSFNMVKELIAQVLAMFGINI